MAQGRLLRSGMLALRGAHGHAGKTGVGKSSTVNSILAEPVAPVVVMQGPASRAQAISRTAAGFTLTLIDTPGVLEGDAVDGAVRSLDHLPVHAQCIVMYDNCLNVAVHQSSEKEVFLLGSDQSQASLVQDSVRVYTRMLLVSSPASKCAECCQSSAGARQHPVTGQELPSGCCALSQQAR